MQAENGGPATSPRKRKRGGSNRIPARMARRSTSITSDPKLGAIVDEDETADAGIISGSRADEKMQTCVRESLLTMSFPPPANNGGVVTVRYPITFSAEP